MMQAVGILSVRVEEVDRGTERWTVSQDSSEEGKGEDDVELIGSVRGREVSLVVHSMTATSSIWPHPLHTLCCPYDFTSAHAYGKKVQKTLETGKQRDGETNLHTSSTTRPF